MSLLGSLLLAAAAASVPLYQTSPAQAQSPMPAPAARQTNSGNTAATVPQQLRRAEPPSPDMSEPQLEARGDVLREEKSYADALDFYHAAMAKQDSAVLHDKAGIAQLEMLHQDEARHEFQRAVKMDKHYAEAYNNLGVIEYIRGKYGKAIKLYDKAIKYGPMAASFHSNLGTAFFARKDYGKAITEYQKAFELDPQIFEREAEGGVSLRLASANDLGRYDYVIAKMYASANKADLCLQYLRKALENGYPQINDVYKDPEFSAVRKDPRFVQLMAAKPPAIAN
jgi:tetratricopeptide (TPR) repeat protein